MKAFKLNHAQNEVFFGERSRAFEFRDDIKRALLAGESVSIDFEKVSTTQSFVDELIGRTVFELGPQILNQIHFKGCSEDSKAYVQLVVNSRVSDYKNKASVA